MIIRSFPVSALHSAKRLGIQRVTTFLPAGTMPVVPSGPWHRAKTVSRGGGVSSGVGSTGGGNGAPRGPGIGVVVGGRGGGISRRNRGASNSSSGLSPGGLVRHDEMLDVLRLRAYTLQMLKLAFDPDEVGHELREELRSLLKSLRYPATLRLGFNPAPPYLVITGNGGSGSDGTQGERVSEAGRQMRSNTLLIGEPSQYAWSQQRQLSGQQQPSASVESMLQLLPKKQNSFR
ncbi:unnamed protein product [Protopolystoma xenopodis]|uniref:Uncharacterized protein n=1 Tax=Protopolystoma xenopodis TaxID=117903 RepID=A0A3S5CIT3_9PLAT|nr:unnamed protein product [Protopolystoma xenopodis]